MAEQLRVLVHGTGFAGQGHAEAFRWAGANIVGIVGRTPAVVKQVCTDMDIPNGGTDWVQAISDCRPDIVCIATPGGAHYDAIKPAIAAGCHVFSDKPLTADGHTAAELARLAKAKGVKTAYASSFRYMPEVQHAKRLVAAGAIGEPLEVECVSHFNLERDIPFGWSHKQADGGGRLNNNFTHKLSIVTAVVGENVTDIMGEVRDDLGRAPIVKGVHNFKTRRDHIPDDLDNPDLAWGESDVEWSYNVTAKIDSPLATRPVTALFKHGGLQPRFQYDYIAFYGDAGAIYIKGHYGSGPLHLYSRKTGWVETPLPADIAARIPDVDGDTERNWRSLARDFIADIKGEPHLPYQGFETGARYQQLIDILRRNDSWTDVSHLS
jgi:predicted dehydrogenase